MSSHYIVPDFCDVPVGESGVDVGAGVDAGGAGDHCFCLLQFSKHYFLPAYVLCSHCLVRDGDGQLYLSQFSNVPCSYNLFLPDRFGIPVGSDVDVGSVFDVGSVPEVGSVVDICSVGPVVWGFYDDCYDLLYQ